MNHVEEEIDVSDMFHEEGKKRLEESLKATGIPPVFKFRDENGAETTIKVVKASKEEGYFAVLIPNLDKMPEESLEELREKVEEDNKQIKKMASDEIKRARAAVKRKRK